MIPQSKNISTIPNQDNTHEKADCSYSFSSNHCQISVFMDNQMKKNSYSNKFGKEDDYFVRLLGILAILMFFFIEQTKKNLDSITM